ncbi:MAG: cation-translocating P-type ATPase [Clostridia bacterium]|nr:cation-translocating P-type ATPase [Clostridia bacterium]
MNYFNESEEKAIRSTDSRLEGLSTDEAQKRLEAEGKNRLKEGKKISILSRILKQVSDPMLLILLAAAVVSGVTAFISGESFADVIIILVVVAINTFLGVFQESKAENAIKALQEIAAATSKVLRNGVLTTIKSEDLVKGDIIVLEAGDSVPADARIIECASMKVEEAALTGESVPVIKHTDALSGEVSLGDRTNMVYMGSTMVYGRGRAVIVGTGMNTEMGKIADALTKTEDSKTPLQKKLNQLSKFLSWLVLGICAVVFLIDVIRIAPDFSFNNILATFMIAVSLAVAAIPEGLATVVTILLSIGVTKMSKQNAVIRKLTAVETLGCTQVICSDKTGTLTQNKMTVTAFTGSKDELVKAMALCNDAELDNDNSAVGEPTECALVNFAYANGVSKNELKASCHRIGEAPFDSMRKMMSTVHDCGGKIVQYTKGAHDEVIRNCTAALLDGKVVPFDDKLKVAALAENKRMADNALRVLCAAMRVWQTAPTDFSAENLEKDLCYVGLTGMIDPVRPEAVQAVKECRQAGIRPIMITGDHIDTAVAIAKELGIINDASQAITGRELSKLSDEEFDKALTKYSVYARVQPEHKVRIVNAWKKRGMITAMTGDGVNDAPSIKAADIGVGMGITGTDVTKNVADMVLADDNFATIVYAVREGRRIYDNIRKSIQFLLASNLSEVITIFAATLLGFTILQPVHLLWINLITDTFPALALGMEKEEVDIMQRPPRNSSDGIFAQGMGVDIAVQGLLCTIITLAAYFIGHYVESGVWEIAQSADGMTMAFLTLSMVEIFHSFNLRYISKSIFAYKKTNIYLLIAAVVSLALLTCVIYIDVLSTAFNLTHISLGEYAIALGLAFAIIPLNEIYKLIKRASMKKRNKQ